MAYSGLNNSMDAAAEHGRNRLGMEMGRVTRGGTVAPVSRDRILRGERGQENIHFPCSANNE